MRLCCIAVEGLFFLVHKGDWDRFCALTLLAPCCLHNTAHLQYMDKGWEHDTVDAVSNIDA